MAFNGSGTFARPVSSYVFDTVISETDVNSEMDGIATGLSTTIAKDGQTTTTARIPFASGIYSDTIAELTTAAGVTVDGALLKDGRIDTTQGADIASATTTNLETATGNVVDVTGTTTITAITLSQGHWRWVRFTGILTLTHGSSLVLPGAANITTAAGDYALFLGYASSVVRCAAYVRASSLPLIDPMTTRGDVIVRNSSNVTARLAIGAANTAQVSDGTDLSYVAIAPLAVANTFTKAQGTTDQGLSDGATITPDASLQNNGYVVLGGNRTLGIPSNLTTGKREAFTYDIYQDSTGSRTLAYAWCYCWAGGTAGTLTTTALARDKLFGHVDYYATSTVTVTIAAPGVMTWTAHGLKTGDRLQLTTTGALPTGLTASTTYYVIKIDADSFWLATSLANAAAATKITTSGSQSGTHTAVACAIDLTLVKAFS